MFYYVTNATNYLIFIAPSPKKGGGFDKKIAIGRLLSIKKHVLALQLTGVSKYGHSRKTRAATFFQKDGLRLSFSHPPRQTNNN